MRKVFRCLTAAGTACLLGFGPQAQAAGGFLIAKVNNVTVVSDARLGGCMALLSVDPQTVPSGCGPNWVSFSCTGDFTDPVRAYRMLDQAQLALATCKNIGVWFQDDKKHNGYCFANRIDIWR